MQEVNFPELPKVEGAKYINAALAILQKVRHEGSDERAFKRWMRGEGYFDKEGYETLKKMLGIITGPDGLTLDGFAQRVLDAHDNPTRQDMFFDRIAGSNEILTKYVFDALTERLYSSNELYRMLTSYVYPGEEISFKEFKHWINWIESTGRIRVLGIRWAPGTRYADSESYLESIDVDDILEEEAEEAMAGTAATSSFAPEPVDAPAPPEPAPPAPAPVAAAPAPEPPAEPTIGWEPPEDDTEDAQEDAPAEQQRFIPGAASLHPPSHAPSVDLTAMVQALQSAQAPALIEARLLAPAPHLSALAAGAPLERIREAMQATDDVKPEQWLEDLNPSEEARAENLRALLEWWDGVEDRPLLRADQHNLMPFGNQGWEDGTRALFLFRLACLATCLLRHPEGDVVFATLDGANFFTKLFETPGSVETLMDELFEQGLGARPELFSLLHLHLMLARSLRGAEEWCTKLAEMPADEAIDSLWQRLAAYQLHEETLWICRELSLFGILRQDELKNARTVPTLEARKAAFHLGFLESTRATSLPTLLAASRRLSPLLAQDMEAPLIAFWRAYGAHPPRRFWTR